MDKDEEATPDRAKDRDNHTETTRQRGMDLRNRGDCFMRRCVPRLCLGWGSGRSRVACKSSRSGP
eukprot:1089360-Alexandrium_andersonii.AAC.1